MLLQYCFCFREIFFLTIFSLGNMINLLWKAAEGYYVCVCIFICFHIFYKESWQTVCAGVIVVNLLLIFLVTFQSACMFYRTKETYCVWLMFTTVPEFIWQHWWQCSRGETHILAFTAALFCPCLLVKCPAVFHSCLSDVLKGRGGTALRAALHQGLLTAVWREGTISGTKGKHTYLVWDKGCPGQLGEGLNSSFVCMQLEDH